ncbi:IKS protein kinase [Helicocarpus griseus UAMH5409]|uniref:non-specific serine/threonine protein kinase n=1 Tax=Helicocarpus griseus UAMH5409 TaxID=1447875 RepID=A0A2B7X628_9EURO|nr:IKS protein kinase [Helicocarpus griseus UAMH5409]
MADNDLSVVRYGAGSTDNIVLRHDDSIVVFDHASQSLVLQHAPEDADVDLTECPYCHRPMRGSPQDGARASSPRANSTPQPGFVNPNYFRMLGSSLPGSPSASRSSSPRRRRLVQEAQPEVISTGTDYGTRPSANKISSAAFSPNYFKRFFVEEGELGRGGKGVVLLVKHVLDGVPLGHYACKRVPVGDDHEWLKKVLIEVQLLQHLSHQNLVSYRHVWLEDVKLSNFAPSVPCAFILQQYCNAGDLHQYICGPKQATATTQQLKERLRRRSKGQPGPPSSATGPRKLQFDEIYSLFKDITSGLLYLHTNGFIHRDLKPNNCLLHETGQELRALVSDFGEVQYEHAVRSSTGNTGTISYCAPEVLRRVSPDGPFGNFTYKSDIFSLGMILYFLCFAQLPYRNADIIDEDREDLDQLRIEISQWAGFDDARRIRSDLPEKLYTFIKRLLSVDPDKRPTAEEVLNGIQAGVAGVNTEGRRFHSHRSNGTSAADIRSGPRVLPVDTPTSPSPTPRGPRSPDRTVSNNSSTFPGGVPILQPTGYQQDDLESTREPDLSLERHRTPSGDQDLVLRNTSTALSPSPVTRRPSQAPTNNNNLNHNHNHIHDHDHDHDNDDIRLRVPSHPLLLPPPAQSTWLSLLNPLTSFSIDRDPAVANIISFSLLVTKVLSITQPCSPLAVSPWILYPLLILAALDFAVKELWVHVVALVFHIAIVAFAARTGVLCVWMPEMAGSVNGV